MNKHVASPARSFPLAAQLSGTRLIDQLEASQPLEAFGSRLRPAAQWLIGEGHRRDALTGRWLSHPVHPAIVTGPMGCWLAALTLDALGGSKARKSSQLLTGLGVIAAVPSLLSGAADWLDTERAEKRVGTAHALGNISATAMFVASYVFRRRGNQRLGVAIGAAGGAVVAAAGFLGGHLAYVRGVGVNTTAFESGPSDWKSFGLVDDPVEGQPIAGSVDGVPLVAVLSTEANTSRLRVLEDRCTHRGAPLHEGTVADGCITCPWHGSRFDLDTGRVVRGPASVPQPTYETSARNGVLCLRRTEEGSLRQNPVTVDSLL